MSLEDWPRLVGLTALSPGHALLHLEDGSSALVDTQKEELCGPGESPFYLATWPHGRVEESRAYAVPDHLQASLYAALNLYRLQEGPPVLTLNGISRQPDAVTFQAVNQEGQPVALTMPRPVFVQPSFPMPPLIEPVGLSVTREEGQGFHFEIHPETPEGRKVLELLGYAERFHLTGEGEV